MIQNLVIFGIGPNCRKTYLDYCLDLHHTNQINILALVDLASKEQEIRSFLIDKKVNYIPFIGIPDHIAKDETQAHLFEFLSQAFSRKEIHKVIISTEPKGHTNIALWSLRVGARIFMDKPVSAFYKIQDYHKLIDDFNSITDLANQKGLEVIICCERRSHLGYQYLNNVIDKIYNETKQAITHIDIHYAGGNLVTQSEYMTKENHPYKYGYGVVLHSGYHYIDLFVSLVAKHHLDLVPSDFEIQVVLLPPNGGPMIPYNDPDCSKLLGECDILIQGKATKKNSVTFSIRLIDNSVSLRTLDKMSDPDYSSFGRIRQENIIIHMGHSASIHIKSLPFKKIDLMLECENFEIDILKADQKYGNHRFDRITLPNIMEEYQNVKLKSSLNTTSRYLQLESFLKDDYKISSINSHKNTVLFIHKIYESIYNLHQEKK